jgi:hypothetical protein
MVQRDNPEFSTVHNGSRMQGWVPAGALLETSVPVAAAKAKATTARMLITTYPPTSFPELSKPIFPSCILSMSVSAIVLKDYRRRGVGELNVIKDALVRVYKQYNYWSYVGIVRSP